MAQDRSSSACLRCRRQKVACNKASPCCLRCVRARVMCEYNKPKHDSPKPAKILDFASDPNWYLVQQPVKIKLKRDRAVLSCIRCRKQKLRCDRNLPCGTCLKHRKGSQCAYADATPSSTPPSTSGSDMSAEGVSIKFIDASWHTRLRNDTHWNNLLDRVSLRTGKIIKSKRANVTIFRSEDSFQPAMPKAIVPTYISSRCPKQ